MKIETKNRVEFAGVSCFAPGSLSIRILKVKSFRQNFIQTPFFQEKEIRRGAP